MIQVAVLWLINDEGEVLLAQRAHHKSQDPSVWGPSVTGKLEPGETFEQALIREVEEELDLKTADYRPSSLFETDFDHPDGEQRKFGVFYATFPKAKTSLIHIDPDEVAAIEWISVSALIEKMRSSAHELVPSAKDTWPMTFEAIWPGTLQTLTDAGVM